MAENNDDKKNAVLLERKGAIAHLKFNRPGTMNSVNGDLCAGLVRFLDELAEDDSIKAVVLSGEGRSFCAGGDLQTIDTAVRSLRRGGRAVIVGIGMEKIKLPAIRTFVGNEYELRGSMGLDVSDLKEVVSLVEQGKLNFEETIKSTSYDEINEALRRLEQGEADEGRYVLTHG